MNRQRFFIVLMAVGSLLAQLNQAPSVASAVPSNAQLGGSHTRATDLRADGTGAGHGRESDVAVMPPPTDAEEEGEALPPANTYSTDYMYNMKNGVVQTDPRVYIIFWGNWTSAGDPDNTQARLYNFYNGLGNTSYGRVLTQYQQGCTAGTWTCTGARAGNPANPYRGWWKDSTNPIPTTPTQAQVAAEAQRAANHFQDFSFNAQYVIALPTGHGDARFSAKGGDACAWHAWTTAGSTWISYTSLPYQPDATNCYTNWVNTNGKLDGVTMVAGHEYAESVTDPGLNAWYDKYGAENGDKCSKYGANYTLSNGFTYPMQQTWSNYHRYYFGAGCRLTW